jgi:hypothetical protein
MVLSITKVGREKWTKPYSQDQRKDCVSTMLLQCQHAPIELRYAMQYFHPIENEFNLC